MRLGRPDHSRTKSAPVVPPSTASSSTGQTLRTLGMLKNMGYHEVWCKAVEVNADTIELAGAEGWRVCDIQGERIKFTLHPGTPKPIPGELIRRPAVVDRERRASERSGTPSQLTLDPLPSPGERYRRASATNTPSPGIQWARRPSAEPPPMVVVSPPHLDELRPPPRLVDPDRQIRPSGVPTNVSSDDERDYFSFIPVPQQDLDDFVPPSGSWLERRISDRSSRPESLDSVYSQVSNPSSPFEFDRLEPFGSRPRRPSPLASQTSFRPITPQLNLAPPEHSDEANQLTVGARPTYRLNRIFSDPGNNSEPSFELLPVMRARSTQRRT